jgi:hypothetical protein
MISKTNVTLETLTLDLAKQFAALPGLLGERPLRDARVTYLNHERENGRFIDPAWAVVLESATGTRYRVNGQHSSTMLSRLAPADFPTGLMVTIEEYTTTDLATDAMHLFNLFDHPRSARTNTDVMGLYRAAYPELGPVDLSLLVSICNGIAQSQTTQPTANRETYPPRDRGTYLRRSDVREFVLWAHQYAGAMHHWMFGKAGIVAEMFLDMQIDKATAQTFWGLTLDESHADPDHESRELSRNLKDLAPKPRVGQDRLQKEAAKFWRRYRRSMAPAPIAA